MNAKESTKKPSPTKITPNPKNIKIPKINDIVLKTEIPKCTPKQQNSTPGRFPLKTGKDSTSCKKEVKLNSESIKFLKKFTVS